MLENYNEKRAIENHTEKRTIIKDRIKIIRNKDNSGAKRYNQKEEMASSKMDNIDDLDI